MNASQRRKISVEIFVDNQIDSSNRFKIWGYTQSDAEIELHFSK